VIAVLAMTCRPLENGDVLPIADPCGPTHQSLLKQFSDAVRGGPVQPFADQLAQRIGNSIGAVSRTSSGLRRSGVLFQPCPPRCAGISFARAGPTQTAIVHRVCGVAI
jgi:hypothetical protein